jgi:hypothetical protein
MVEVTVLHIRTSSVWNVGWCLHFMSDKHIWCDCVSAFRLGSGSSRCPKCSTYCICYRLVNPSNRTVLCKIGSTSRKS